MRKIETRKASVAEAVAFIERLNYMGETFAYSNTNYEYDPNVKYRHFDSYKANGEMGGFGLIEIVVGGKLQVVRFFNLYRNITVDFRLGDYTPDYSDFDFVIDVDAAVAAEEVANAVVTDNAVPPITVEAAREAGLTYEEYLAARAGLTLAQYLAQQQEEKAAQEARALQSKIFNLRSTIGGLEYKINQTVRWLNYMASHHFNPDKPDASLDEYATELGAEIIANLNTREDCKAQLAALIPTTDPDPVDYAVSIEAQDAAIDAEIELANVEFDETAEVLRGCELLDSLNIPWNLFAALPVDPNAEKFWQARFLTTVAFKHAEQKANLPQRCYGIRSTDFNRAEKALHILKDALADLPIVFVEEPVIKLMPKKLNSDEEQIPVFYFPDDDGSNNDPEDDDLPTISTANDSDDDELIDPPKITAQVAPSVVDDFDAKLAAFKTKRDDALSELRQKEAALYNALHDSPAQIYAVTNRLNAAIVDGATDFKFPTIEELTAPTTDTTVRAQKNIDSLFRAMETNLLRVQDACRNKNLSAAILELQLYQTCAAALNVKSPRP